MGYVLYSAYSVWEQTVYIVFTLKRKLEKSIHGTEWKYTNKTNVLAEIGIWRKLRCNSGNCRMMTYLYFLLGQMDHWFKIEVCMGIIQAIKQTCLNNNRKFLSLVNLMVGILFIISYLDSTLKRVI